MRQQCSFTISNPFAYKSALLKWSKAFPKVIWLDSNAHISKYGSFDFLLAVGKQTDKSISLDSFDPLKRFVGEKQDWLFGFFSYDFKNQLEDLDSKNFDGLDFPVLHFFQPTKIIKCNGSTLQFLYLDDCSHEIEEDFTQIGALMDFDENDEVHTPIKIKMRIHKDAYFEKANKLLEHIHRGDIYEANFCQEFYAEGVSIDPWETYQRLNAISEPPFAAFMRFKDKYLMCASPERYIRKQGTTVLSQPIKGTSRRDGNQTEDEILKNQLALDEKERAENIMITDLVRNDLSKSALKGSVVVEELCKVYTYKQVHQLISTVTAEIPLDKNPVELIEETFPMGSMTGAPKISAMKIIEGLEETKRGLYSGAVGYFDPEGNFDFNVVIRSILYNATSKYASFSVGSAITAKSDPEREYQECLLKAKAMRSVLETGE